MDRPGRSQQDATTMLMKDQPIPIEAIYVPTKRRATLDPATVEKLAASILEEGQRTPILVRPDGDRRPGRGAACWRPASPWANYRRPPGEAARRRLLEQDRVSLDQADP
jgi:hypothetical protein